jgi:ribosomal protein S6
MKIKIKFEDGETKELNYWGDKTFPEWIQHFYGARYYMLNNNSEVGNLALDTHKVKYVELID